MPANGVSVDIGGGATHSPNVIALIRSIPTCIYVCHATHVALYCELMRFGVRLAANQMGRINLSRSLAPLPAAKPLPESGDC